MKMRMGTVVLLLMAILVAPAHARDWRRAAWRASQAAVGVLAVADVGSTWGKGEANPLLQSRGGGFGARGVALKAGIVGGWLVGQELLGRHRPQWQPALAVANTGMAVVTGWTVKHNLGVPK
jgi:hypothetical protein